ncbi:MAG TPA: hypothetical protein VGF59_10915 [Bryobacteraceae bacterium]
MLLMKAWMETRWRILGGAVYLLIALGLNYRNPGGGGVLTTAWFMLTLLAISLGGSGVNSQAPLGLSEGIAGSTQFTIALPVTRLRLLAIRAAVGLVETAAAAAVTAFLIWALFPATREATTAADFARLVVTTIVFLTAPCCAHVFFSTWSQEPFSLAYAGGSLMLLLLLCHHLTPGMDILSAFGEASPLKTHRLP